LAIGETSRRISQRIFKDTQSRISSQLEFSHMTEVENSGGLPHRAMFLDYATVAEWHFEAAEFSHPGAQRTVQRIERSTLDPF
jgi:hypothetical protein